MAYTDDWESLMNGVFGAGGKLKFGGAQPQPEKPQPEKPAGSGLPDLNAALLEQQKQLDELLKQQNARLKAQDAKVQTALEDSRRMLRDMEADGLLAKGTADTKPEQLGSFEGLTAEVKKTVLGQDAFVDSVVRAMRRPFVLGTEGAAARNVILLWGAPGTGRHFALAETARIMAARGLLQSDRMAVMDLALYPDPGTEKLFLQDLYAALHAPGEIVVFEHYESCHPGFLRILSDLAVKGSAPLSSRYLVNKEGILVEAGTALAPGAVSRIDPCGKYLIFFSRKGREALADKFGASFVAAVGDVCQTAPFTPEALAALAAQQLNALAQRVHSRLGLTLAAGAEVRDYVAAQCSKEKGAEGLADCCERIFRALSEYCLQTDTKLSGTVALTAAQDAPIYYTLDGSTPDENAARYEQPIEVARTAVLRACSILPGRAASATMTQTYFISTYHTMPILALTTDPENLFNETDGMLADGNELDREAQKRPWMKAVYRQKKKNKGYIEWYDTDGRQRLSQGMIFSCMGQYSLDMPQKSFSIRANAQFGADTFDVAAFEDRPYTSYAAFALRNGGQDGLYTRVLDGLQQRLAEQSGTSVITQAWRPVIVYINGAYWGHYNLRERIGAKMIAQHEGWKHPEFVDLLEGDGAVNQGSAEDYRALTAYVKAHDLAAEPEALAHVLDHVDVENLIDYFFFEMFVGNEDAGNIRFYRNAVEGDGKWRYVLYDLDWGLFDSGNGGPAFVMNENGMGRYHIQSNILLVKLMQVPEIRAQFLTRAGELFQTVFTTENMIALLDEMTAQIQPEMAMHFERWAAEMYPQLSFDQPKNPAGAYAYWQERIERAKNVMKKRPTRFYDMMQETFGLTDEEMAAYFGARPELPADAI